MTRNKAIEMLKGFHDLNYTDWWDEECDSAVDMAIEALKEQSHDGCDGCAYESCGVNQEPCVSCKQSYMDKYKRKNTVDDELANFIMNKMTVGQVMELMKIIKKTEDDERGEA